MNMWLIFILCFVLANSEIGNTERDALLSKLTELDDYDECLSGKEGLYCFGTFLINPNDNATDKYNFIREYSSLDRNFDWTRINRGYCVSSRCPPNSNTTHRFENCVQTRSLQEGLNTTLETLHYCRTPKKPPMNLSSKTFLVAMLFVLLANFVGTVYDMISDGNDKRSIFWTGLSIRSNWKQLMEPFGNDPDITALAPIQAMRVALMSIVIVMHVPTIIIAFSYMENPESIEQLILLPIKFLFAKEAPVVQIFFALSSFLTAYKLLLDSKKEKIGFWILPKQLLKRYFRIAPVHLLFVWFVAVMWPYISDGPMWLARINREKAICREKLWSHIFHVQNIVEPNQHCLPQTWSLAVDLQLQLISLLVTLGIAQYNLPIFKTLSALFVGSCSVNAGFAYFYKWKPFHYIFNVKNAVNMFGYIEGYVANYYISMWGSLPSCIIGLFMAHLYFKLRQEFYKIYKLKWFRLLSRIALPAFLLWLVAGCFIREPESRLLSALYVALERPIFCILPCVWLFGMINGIKIYPGYRALSKHMWFVLGKLSLSVLMVHWVIIETQLSSLPQPVWASIPNMVAQAVVTWILSYSMAVPITLLIEFPALNTYNYVASKIDIKLHEKYKLIARNLLKIKYE